MLYLTFIDLSILLNAEFYLEDEFDNWEISFIFDCERENCKNSLVFSWISSVLPLISLVSFFFFLTTIFLRLERCLSECFSSSESSNLFSWWSEHFYSSGYSTIDGDGSEVWWCLQSLFNTSESSPKSSSSEV